MATKLYVLLLQSEKYYIGKSTQVFRRISDHFNGRGSAWTKKYHPIDVIKVSPMVTQYDEDNETLDYMQKYGIDNVRGGIYSRCVLSASDKKSIYRRISGSNDCCFNCGHPGHFAEACPTLYFTEDYSNTESKITCNKVGEYNHNINDCYDCMRDHGMKVISDIMAIRDKNISYNYLRECSETVIAGVSDIPNMANNQLYCYRCKRRGHISNHCYAKTYANGDAIM